MATKKKVGYATLISANYDAYVIWEIPKTIKLRRKRGSFENIEKPGDWWIGKWCVLYYMDADDEIKELKHSETEVEGKWWTKGTPHYACDKEMDEDKEMDSEYDEDTDDDDLAPEITGPGSEGSSQEAAPPSGSQSKQ